MQGIYILIYGLLVVAISACGNGSIYEAAHNGHTPAVKSFLRKDPSSLESRQFGRTPLLEAARNNHWVVIETLIESGANTKATDNNGNTAIHLLAEFPEDLLTTRGHLENTMTEAGRLI